MQTGCQGFRRMRSWKWRWMKRWREAGDDGFPSNWSAGMMGMMTMVRVLPDKEYEEMQERIQKHKG